MWEEAPCCRSIPWSIFDLFHLQHDPEKYHVPSFPRLSLRIIWGGTLVISRWYPVHAHFDPLALMGYRTVPSELWSPPICYGRTPDNGRLRGRGSAADLLIGRVDGKRLNVRTLAS